MSRIRTIKPDFWRHPVMGRQSGDMKCLAIGILNISDDEGYFRAEPELIRADIMPYFKGTLNDIEKQLTELSVNTQWVLIRTHKTQGKIGYIPGFLEHQRVNRPTPSKLSEYWKESPITEESVSNHGGLTPGKERKGKEGKGREDQDGTRAGARKQTKRATQLPDNWNPNEKHDQIALRLKVSVSEQAEQFRDYHKAKGSTMKDWDAAFRTWLRNSPKFGWAGTNKSKAESMHQRNLEVLGLTGEENDDRENSIEIAGDDISVIPRPV